MKVPKPTRERTHEETEALDVALNTFIVTDDDDIPDAILFDLERHAVPVLSELAKTLSNEGDFARIIREEASTEMSHLMLYLCVREIARRRREEVRDGRRN